MPALRFFAVLCLLSVAACSDSHPTCTGSGCVDAMVPTDSNTMDDVVNTTDTASVDLMTSCLPHAATIHRAAATTCDNTRLPGTTPDPGGAPAECASDTECTAGNNGRCNGNGHDGWRCTYDECFADTDCESSEVCQCEGGFRADANVCQMSNCRTNADCATGFCSPTLGSCGHYTGTVGWFCHTCEDTCINDDDCTGAEYCALDPVLGYWQCQDLECVG